MTLYLVGATEADAIRRQIVVGSPAMARVIALRGENVWKIEVDVAIDDLELAKVVTP